MAATHPVLSEAAEWTLHLDLSSIPLTNAEFYRICSDNPELRMELTAAGQLILMSPTGGKTGARNSELNFQLRMWAKRDGSGITFDFSTFFSLPNGAKRSPDAAWIRKERWEALSEVDKEKFAPLCPGHLVHPLVVGQLMYVYVTLIDNGIITYQFDNTTIEITVLVNALSYVARLAASTAGAELGFDFGVTTAFGF
jgi:Putative restriction endonuclease